MKLSRVRLDEIKAKNYPQFKLERTITPKEGKSLDELITKEEQENLTSISLGLLILGLIARSILP